MSRGAESVIQPKSNFEIAEGTDRCLCDSGGQRPDYLGGAIMISDPRLTASITGRPNSWFDGTGGGTATGAPIPYFRRVGSGLSFALGAGWFGNLGRNVFHGPGIHNWDVSVVKRIQVKEQQQLEFRTEFLNVFNHAQFQNPSGSINSVDFGRITNTLSPRIVEISLRYAF